MPLSEDLCRVLLRWEFNLLDLNTNLNKQDLLRLSPNPFSRDPSNM